MVHNVAAVVWLRYVVHVTLFPILNVLYFYITTFPHACAKPNMAVFCSSIVTQIFGVDLEMVPVAPIVTAVTFIFNSKSPFLL
jgi:hypothetical protein